MDRWTLDSKGDLMVKDTKKNLQVFIIINNIDISKIISIVYNKCQWRDFHITENFCQNSIFLCNMITEHHYKAREERQ